MDKDNASLTSPGWALVEGILDRVSEEEAAVVERYAHDHDTLAWLVEESDDELRRCIAMLDFEGDLDQLASAGLVASGKQRSPVEMLRFRLTLYDVVREQRPMTVRQVFYQMVTRGLPKAENHYQRVQQELVKMRRGDAFPVVPWGWIADGTRWMRKPTTDHSLRSMFRRSIKAYRRAIWDDQDAYVELWIEKDALAGVLYDETSLWDVPLMVSRGFSSVTFLWEAADAMRRHQKPCYVYVFTDADRSGHQIANNIARDLREMAPHADIYVERAAVTDAQIEELELPTRPAKRRGDPPAVELDAIPPGELRAIARRCIEQHVDREALRRTREAEESERETLEEILDNLVA